MTPPNNKTAEDLSDTIRLRMVVKMLLLGTLAWDYTDTVLKIAAQMQIQETKKVSRAIKEIKREYDQFISPMLHGDDTRFLSGLSVLFEDVNAKAFKRLCDGLAVEIGSKVTPSDEEMYLLKAVQMVMTVLDAMNLYDADCRAWMEAEGVPNHTVIPSHFARLAILIPQYAGNCYDPKSESRRITAKILYNETKLIELYGDDGKRV